MEWPVTKAHKKYITAFAALETSPEMPGMTHSGGKQTRGLMPGKFSLKE